MHRILPLLFLLLALPLAAQAQPVCPADFQGQQAPLTCACPPGAMMGGTVWGSGLYTTDSRICRAALHAGAIGQGGGVVTVTPAPGQQGYQGSVRNGVQTQAYGPWGASFTVAAGGSGGKADPTVRPEVTAAACPANFEGIGRPITCACIPGAPGGEVWGTGVYSADSNICRAALHIGLITPQGGSVNVVPAPGLPTYFGSASNGVQTADYGAWGESFTFRR